MDYVRALGTDERFEPTFMQLLDFRLCRAMRLDADELRKVGHASPYRADARRVALVSTDLAFGMARMYGLQRGEAGEHFMVTRSLDEAMGWLGVGACADSVVAALEALPEVCMHR